jgi:hypothetical protein
MNDYSPITPVTFNEATRKFNFELPLSVCDCRFGDSGLGLGL